MENTTQGGVSGAVQRETQNLGIKWFFNEERRPKWIAFNYV